MSSSLREGALFANLTSQQLAVFTNVPMMPPPPGLKTNLQNPSRNSNPFFIVTSILLFVMTVLIINRIYAKTYIIRKYTWDDLAVPIWFFAAFNGIAIGTIRVTFFIAYLNIFGTLTWLRMAAYIGGTFTALYHIAISVLVFVLTTPAPGHTWFSAITTEEYQRFLKTLVPGHAVRFAIDMYILVLPLIAVSQIQLPTRKKIGVCLIFLTGLTACIASGLTVYYMDLLVKTPNTTGALMPVCTVILAEMFLGIIVLCIPAVARSCRHHSDYFQKIRSSISSKITRQGSTSTALTAVESNGPYFDINREKPIRKYPFAYAEGPRTRIKGGDPHEIDEDGVRLTYEMKTSVHERKAENSIV
ncbi:MAG: hypothetical protein Q9170_002755 [Blastenia crenularia]